MVVAKDAIHILWLLSPFIAWSSVTLGLVPIVLAILVIISMITAVTLLEPVRRVKSKAGVVDDIQHVAFGMLYQSTVTNVFNHGKILQGTIHDFTFHLF